MAECQTLLLNPVAGAGHPLDRWPGLVAVLERRGPLTCLVAETPEHLDAAAREAAVAGRTLIVAGGDGTWNRVVNAVDGQPITLGLLPTGSGNDWCRALGLPTDPAAAADVIASGTPRRIDLIAVNGRRFCTVGGVGLFAETALLVSRWGAPGVRTRAVVRSLGAQAYLAAAIARLCAPTGGARPVEVHGAGPDGEWSWIGRAHTVFVANQQRLGAGLVLPLAARPDDGVCEIGIVPERGRLSLAWKLQVLRSGRPVGDDVLIVTRVRTARILSDEPLAFAADGEPQTVAATLDVEICPGAIRVLT
jgi:diacylglycerol kinase (ATP)